MTELGGATRLPDANSAEVLSGASAIAAFMFGDRKFRRKVYYLAEKHGLPVFRIGANLCARANRLNAWLEAKERESAASARMLSE